MNNIYKKMKNLIRTILKEYKSELITESGIRDINNIAKRYQKAKIYFHQDLDGVATAIAMKKYLEDNGIKVVEAEIIQYGSKEFAIAKPLAEGDTMPVLVDFAHGKPMFVIHTDHHDSQAGVEKDTATSFKHARSNVETISQSISPKELFKAEDIKIISTIDSANYAINKITPEMVMNFIFKIDKNKSAEENKMLMGLVVNKLLLAYKNYPKFMEYLVLNTEPSIEALYNNITRLAKERDYANVETMQKNQEKYLDARSQEGVIKKYGNILSQYDLGSMRKGSYDRYTPYKLYPDADFLVTGMGGQVGMVQASCNPFKEDRALKGVNLGEIKDQVLEHFRPELEKQILPFWVVRKIAEREATPESVGFTLKDMKALFGDSESYQYDEKGNPYVNGYDFLKANSGGHKCITNISGINFLYNNYHLPYAGDLDKEAKPIAHYTGKNKFVKDVQSKLLRFRKISDAQKNTALKVIRTELGVGQDEDIPKGRSYQDLVKDMQNYFVELLQKKVEESETLNESEKKNFENKLKITTVHNFIKKLKLSENICFAGIVPAAKINETPSSIDVIVGIKFINEWEGREEMKSIRKKFDSVFKDRVTLFFFPNYSSEPEIQQCKETIETFKKSMSIQSNELILYEPNEKVEIAEKWSEKYKKSINCNNPRGFSQRAHCQGRKKHKK